MLHRSVRALKRRLPVLFKAALVAGALGVLVAGVQLWNRLSLPMNATTLGWAEDWPEFGGWSGLDVTPDGGTLWIVSDGSLFVRADLQRGAEGRLEGLRARHLGFLIPPRPQPPDIPEDRGYRDAESLALDADGVPIVTFERIPRLIALPQNGGRQEPRLPPRAAAGVNSGIEAFAIAPDGTAYAIPERPPWPGRAYGMWRQDGAGWAPAGRIPRQGRWRAVGADIGPDGQLYLLERGFTLFSFTSRVRRLDPAKPERAEVVYLSPPGRHGNLEGLGVWQDADGHLRLLMVADDNLYPFQRGGFVEIRLPLAQPSTAE